VGGYVHPAQRAVEDAYKRTNGPVAFLDESYQAPDGVAEHRQTFYLFSAVVVDLKDMATIRSGMRRIVGSHYWHTRDALMTDAGWEQTRELLAYLAEGGEPCVIAHQVEVDAGDGDAEEARRACYHALAVELSSGRQGVWDPIDLLVLEERNVSNLKNRDQANHKDLVSCGSVPRKTRLLQTSPASEHLLWLPDLVSSALRRTITHDDDTLFDVIREQVHVIAA
jgi:hypothetical protein